MVQDGATGLPVAGAIVTLVAASDTTVVHRAFSDSTGAVLLGGVPAGSYACTVTHLAYHRHHSTFRVTGVSPALGTLRLRPRTIPIEEVLVRATPPAVQKADTTEYVADAFKLNRDAQAEDLLLKLPGVSVIDGIVKAGGDEVRQVLVDGRPFFGTDPLIALRNLPADAIEKIQVFEKMSEQAEFSGFDDGRGMRTINIITRESRRRSQFGRAAAGYGERGTYAVTGSGNIFNGTQRVSLLGQSNNANQQNFSAQDILGDLGGGMRGGGGPRGMRGGRPPGGPGGPSGGPPPGGSGRMGAALELASSMIGVQSGLATIHSIGTNYADLWQGGSELNGSYFFNRSVNANAQTARRDYGMTGGSQSTYDESSARTTGNNNHRLSMRVELPIDSMNSLIFTPAVSVQNTDASTSLFGQARSGTDPGSDLASLTTSSASGFTLGQNLLLRHRFDLPGRTLSVDGGLSVNARNRSSYLGSSLATTGNAVPVFTRQNGDNTTRGTTISGRLAFTEPVTVDSRLQLEISSSYSTSSSGTRTFSGDTLDAGITALDTTLSNTYENRYWSNRAGMSYQVRTEGLRFTAGTSVDFAVLRGERSFPSVLSTRRSFTSLLPSVSLDYSPRAGTHLRAGYRVSTQAPSIEQLQDVVNNTNQLLLTAGNPDLAQSIAHSLSVRHLSTEADRATSRMLMVAVTMTRDHIGNAIRTLRRDTVLAGGVRGTAGAQLTTPQNMHGYWNARTSADLGFPFLLIESNMNVSANAGYTRSPGLLDDQGYSTSTWTLGAGCAIGTNVSRELDGHLSYEGSYSRSRNTLTPDVTTAYLTHTVRFRSTVTLLDVVVMRNEVSYTGRTGLSGGSRQESLLWNASCGVKFLGQNRGELRLAVYDVLNRNRSLGRTVTEAYVEDTTNQVLPRYLMLTFEYAWR